MKEPEHYQILKLALVNLILEFVEDIGLLMAATDRGFNELVCDCVSGEDHVSVNFLFNEMLETCTYLKATPEDMLIALLGQGEFFDVKFTALRPNLLPNALAESMCVHAVGLVPTTELKRHSIGSGHYSELIVSFYAYFKRLNGWYSVRLTYSPFTVSLTVSPGQLMHNTVGGAGLDEHYINACWNAGSGEAPARVTGNYFQPKRAAMFATRVVGEDKTSVRVIDPDNELIKAIDRQLVKR